VDRFPVFPGGCALGGTSIEQEDGLSEPDASSCSPLPATEVLAKERVLFSSIPSVAGKSTERDRKTHLINRWLRDWCHWWNFGFFDHGEVYMAQGVLVTDGVQLFQRGTRILAHKLAGLIERALNQVQRGKGTSPSSLEMSPGMACQCQG